MLLAAIIIGVFSFNLRAQEDSDKKARIKVITHENGEVKKIDTTVVLSETVSLKDVLKDMNIDIHEGEDLEDFDLELSEIDADEKGYKYVSVLKGDMVEYGGGHKMTFDVYISDTADLLPGDCNDHDIYMWTDEEGNVSMVAGDHKVTQEIECEDGKKVMVLKTTVNGESGEKKDLRVICKSIHDADGDMTVDVLYDSMDEHMMIYSDEEGDGHATTIIICHTSMGEDNEEVKIKTKISVTDPEEEDFTTLKQGSFAPSVPDNDLDIDHLVFYPNPNKGKFTLSFNTDKTKKVEIRVFDMNGNEVYKEELKDFEGEYKKEIDISGEKKGTYFVNIVQDGKSVTKKIIIE